VAFARNGRILTSSAPTGGSRAWRAVPGFRDAGNELGSAVTTSVTDLSCPSTSLCAIGDYGQVAFTSDPLGSTSRWRLASSGGRGWITALACPTPDLCVGSGTTSRIANLVASSDPRAGRWHPVIATTGTDWIFSIACPSAALCLAAGDYGLMYASTRPLSHHWTRTGASDTIADLACPTAQLCLGVSEVTAGRIDWTTRPASTSRWRHFALHGLGPQAIACPSVSLCVVGGTRGIAVSSNPTGGPSAWAITRTPVPIDSVACPSASLCLAGGERGALLIGEAP
jgi:hypothetical protein